MTKSPVPVRVDIISDVVCPWCIIGYKQLEQAVAATGIDAEIHWHPFELNPDMIPEGENLREHVVRKYGASVEDSARIRTQITGYGEQLGFSFNFSEEMRMVNTFRAHQLMKWAEQFGRKHALKLAFFAAYFSDGRDLGDPEVLVEIAAGTGLDADEARSVLAEDRYAEEIREQEQFWTSQGIQSVPAMVFAGRYLTTGAQGAENYATVLERAIEDAA